MALISICLPTYEPKPAHLREAIDSVLRQTFTDWELIINDDASKAEIRKIAEPFLNDQRIRLFKNDGRLGIGGNWNATTRKGSAPFVAYLFQDDLWKPKYLERSVKILQDTPELGFTAANHSYRIEATTAAADTGIYAEVEALRTAVLHEGRIHCATFLKHWIERGLRPNLIGEPSFVVLRRAMIQEAGPFLEDMRQGLDAEYWIRCLLLRDGWWIAEKLGEFRVHAAGATAKNEDSGTGRTDRLRTFKILIAALPAGEMKSLARRIRRSELLKMAGKFMKRLVHYRG